MPDYNMVIDPDDISKLIMYIGMIFGVMSIITVVLYMIVLNKYDLPDAELQLRNFAIMTFCVFGATLVYWYKYG